LEGIDVIGQGISDRRVKDCRNPKVGQLTTEPLAIRIQTLTACKLISNRDYFCTHKNLRDETT
jgi:hypothetical protein